MDKTKLCFKVLKGSALGFSLDCRALFQNFLNQMAAHKRIPARKKSDQIIKHRDTSEELFIRFNEQGSAKNADNNGTESNTPRKLKIKKLSKKSLNEGPVIRHISTS